MRERFVVMQRVFRRTLPPVVLAGLVASCATFEESGLPGSASSMANNQMMYVAAQPETFGHYRLMLLMRQQPDLEVFVRQRGMPEFLAETRSGHKSYYILYYLRDRQAFVARTRSALPQRLEFAGPYPITDKESAILKGLRDDEGVGKMGGKVRVD